MPRRDLADPPVADADRGSFATVTLTIPVEDAVQLAGMQVAELSIDRHETEVALRTDAGDLVAVATERRLRDGSAGTSLAYRADEDGGIATEIRRAVGAYES